MANFCLRLATVEAVVSFYALIHVPLADQLALFPRIRAWRGLAGISWPLPEPSGGQASSPISAPACSGSMPAPPSYRC